MGAFVLLGIVAYLGWVWFETIVNNDMVEAENNKYIR